MATNPSAATSDGTWLSRWEPENDTFWRSGGSSLAWRTLTITTLNLTMAFIVWFLVSALVVRLPQIGFQFTPSQLFWLAAMPGLAGGTLRLDGILQQGCFQRVCQTLPNTRKCQDDRGLFYHLAPTGNTKDHESS